MLNGDISLLLMVVTYRFRISAVTYRKFYGEMGGLSLTLDRCENVQECWRNWAKAFSSAFIMSKGIFDGEEIEHGAFLLLIRTGGDISQLSWVWCY